MNWFHNGTSAAFWIIFALSFFCCKTLHQFLSAVTAYAWVISAYSFPILIAWCIYITSEISLLWWEEEWTEIQRDEQIKAKTKSRPSKNEFSSFLRLGSFGSAKAKSVHKYVKSHELNYVWCYWIALFFYYHRLVLLAPFRFHASSAFKLILHSVLACSLLSLGQLIREVQRHSVS